MWKGTRGGQSYRNWEKNQGGNGGSSQNSQDLSRERLEEWRDIGEDWCVQGNITGMEILFFFLACKVEIVDQKFFTLFSLAVLDTYKIKFGNCNINDHLLSGNGECKERDRRPGTHRSLSASCQTQEEERVLLQGDG